MHKAKNTHSNIAQSIFIVVVIVTFAGLFFVPYSFDDIGYYFKYAQEIANGHNGLLYRDIKLNYSPLPMILYSWVFVFFRELPPNYAFLIVNFIFIIGSTLIISKILSLFDLKKSSIYIALSVYLMSVNAIGTSSTEHFVMFFELLMIYLLISAKNWGHYVFAGISAFLAFYSKQYGIVCIFMGLLWFVYPANKLNRLGYFLLGLIIPNVLLYIYYLYFGNDFSLLNMYMKLLFPKDNETTLTGENYKIIVFIIGLVQFLMISLYVFPAIFIYLRKNLFGSRQLNYILLFIIANMSPLLIASYFHYYLLILPLVVIVSVIILNEMTFAKSINLVIMFSILIISIFTWTGAFIRIKKLDNKWQSTRVIKLLPNADLEITCADLNKIIPRGSKVFIEAHVFFYYPADFYSIDFKHLGYTWAQQHNHINDVLKYMDSGEYLITSKRSRFNEYPQFVENIAMKSKDYEVFSFNNTFPVGNNSSFYIVLKK